MNRIFFLVAVVGLVLSAIVHWFSIYRIELGEQYPVTLLNFGIFIVFIPAVLNLKKNPELQKNTIWKEDPMGLEKINIMFRGTPRWMAILVGVLFVYTMVNAWVCANPIGGHGVLGVIDGQEVFHNHGEIIKVATEEDISAHKAKSARFSSGMWMPFYALSMAVLFPSDNKMKNV